MFIIPQVNYKTIIIHPRSIPPPPTTRSLGSAPGGRRIYYTDNNAHGSTTIGTVRPDTRYASAFVSARAASDPLPLSRSTAPTTRRRQTSRSCSSRYSRGAATVKVVAKPNLFVAVGFGAGDRTTTTTAAAAAGTPAPTPPESRRPSLVSHRPSAVGRSCDRSVPTFSCRRCDSRLE